MPVICLSVDMHVTRDHVRHELVPSFCSLWIVCILRGLPLPRLRILDEGAFLVMELAEDAYR
jgi:hypothetical protein